MSNFEFYLYPALFYIIPGSFLFLLYKSPLIIRHFRMKNLAKKFNLKYERMVGLPRFEMLSSGKEKRNRLSGKINGKQLEIYDFLYYGWTHGFGRMHFTKLILDGKEIVSYSIIGFLSIRVIKKWLEAIRDNTEYIIKDDSDKFNWYKYSCD